MVSPPRGFLRKKKRGGGGGGGGEGKTKKGSGARRIRRLSQSIVDLIAEPGGTLALLDYDYR